MSDIKALGKMNIGIARILQKYPLFGGLVASWTIREDASVKTMAVGMGPTGIILYFAPKFVNRLTVDGVVAVLHHEVRHVVYGHVYANRKEIADYDALVIAEEVTVNEQLPEKLPVRGILLKDYSILKPDQDTVTRYNILAKNSSKLKQQATAGPGKKSSSKSSSNTKSNGNGGSQGGGAGMPVPCPNGSAGQPTPVTQGADGGVTIGVDVVGNNQAPHPNDAGTASPCKSASNKKGTKPNPHGTKGRQLDNHDRWDSIKADESFAKATVEATLIDLLKKGAKPTEYEQKVIAEAMKGRGWEAGNGISSLDPSDKRTLSWRSLLRRYVGSELERVASFIRPNRRFPDMVGIVPGHYSCSAKPKVMAVIDTSGSMSDGNLADISKELGVMARTFEVHVVECDAVIHQDYRYKGPIKTVLGRGGTSFLPPLEKEFLKKVKPDLIIFFTDGDGDVPEQPPKVPVIWVLTAGGNSPVQWGRIIHMDEEEAVGE